MIVRFAKAGTSFQGVSRYLMHDPDHASTDARVAWTHTLNLANDDIGAATAEMMTTALNADVLKAQHGIGGRRVERPVRHLSLNWHPDEKPEREAMVAAATSFLKHMGWEEHQTLIIAHDDKAYRHVHLVVNAIHPETGRKLDDGFERRRAQAWALAYEQAHGQVHCKERLKPAAEREESPPRPAWMVIRETPQESFSEDYMARHESRLILEKREWELLKDLQKAERIAFFENGHDIYKAINRAVYREVREEFRSEWASYYAARREGVDAEQLASMRSDLLERQGSVLEERRGDAIAEVRVQRDAVYRDILDRQKDERGDLQETQELGLRSHDLLDRAYPIYRDAGQEAKERDQSDADEALDRLGVTRGRSRPTDDQQRGGAEFVLPEFDGPFPSSQQERSPSREPLSGVAGGLLGVLGNLGESLIGGHTRLPPKPAPEPDALDRFKIQRGQPPPGEETELATKERARAFAERREWRVTHGYEPER